jgi:hypothetical protein
VEKSSAETEAATPVISSRKFRKKLTEMIRSQHETTGRTRGRRRTIRHTGIAIIVGALGFLAIAEAPLAALTNARQIAFDVFRDGEPLGHHHISIRHEADEVHVEIDIELEVNLAFITVFRYDHSNREIWKNGQLVSIDTRTDDDGTAYWLRGRATEDGFQVEGTSGSFLAPASVMPTSYWNAAIVDHTELLDTQHGRLIDVTVRPGGDETVMLEGRSVAVKRFQVSGDLDLTIWYTHDGEWAKTSFEARGAEIVYVR